MPNLNTGRVQSNCRAGSNHPSLAMTGQTPPQEVLPDNPGLHPKPDRSLFRPAGEQQGCQAGHLICPGYVPPNSQQFPSPPRHRPATIVVIKQNSINCRETVNVSSTATPTPRNGTPGVVQCTACPSRHSAQSQTHSRCLIKFIQQL